MMASVAAFFGEYRTMPRVSGLRKVHMKLPRPGMLCTALYMLTQKDAEKSSRNVQLVTPEDNIDLQSGQVK